MASESRANRPKTIPTILSKIKAMQNSGLSHEPRERETGRKGRGGGGGGGGGGGEEGSRVSRGNSEDNARGCVDDGAKGRLDPRITPRLAWAARRDSTMSTLSSLNNGLGESQKGLLSRIPSLMSLGGSNTAWGKRLRRKRDAEEYAAQKLLRQKEEMIAFYRGTPMTNDKATSSEILRFLYDMWEPQLCSSYRKDAKITTSCRQDLRSAKRIVQTTPRRIAKYHRARLVIDTSQRFGSSASESGRSSGMRPISAKSVT